MAEGRDSTARTAIVNHLGGIQVGYRISNSYVDSKPTLVLLHGFAVSAEIYASQFSDKALTDALNLIAVEHLGHGNTHLIANVGSETFTYWDSAIMINQLLEVLGIKKAFVLGTAQGGWTAARMALLDPDKISGIILSGTSMDYESKRSQELGCWDPYGPVTGLIEALSSTTPFAQFEPPDEFCNFNVTMSFGADCEPSLRTLWCTLMKKNYVGDEGRKRLREAAVNLRDRDGLHGRLYNIKCPVLWVQGDTDAAYSVKNAEEEIKLFVNASEANLQIVEGGYHFLNVTHAQAVDQAVLKFVTKHSS